MSYFPGLHNHSKAKIKLKLNLSNYATKSESATGIDTSKWPKKVNLASLKSDIDELDIDKLKTVPFDLSKLSNVVKNNVVKQTVYDELVKMVGAI